MTLALEAPSKYIRNYRLRCIHRAKLQLIRAYVSGKPKRVTQAKLNLAKHLRELGESPELGPPPRFNPGVVLLWQLSEGFDPKLTEAQMLACEGRVLRVAQVLEMEVRDNG